MPSSVGSISALKVQFRTEFTGDARRLPIEAKQLEDNDIELRNVHREKRKESERKRQKKTETDHCACVNERKKEEKRAASTRSHAKARDRTQT
jgi:hypothetical protein